MRCGIRSSRARATSSSLRRSSRSGVAWPRSWPLSSCRGRRARPCPSSSPRRSSISSILSWSDCSIAAPISRSLIRSCAGLRPLIAAIIALVTLGEAPGPIASLGVAALVAGVLAMGASGFAHGRINRPTIIVALANSAVIAIYSVIDGQGARISGAGSAFAFAYNSWADALTALAYLPIILCLRGRAALAAVCRGLAARPRRRPRRLFRLCDRRLGDDPSPDRRCRRPSRDVGRVRGDHRRRGAPRAVPCATGGGRARHSRWDHPSAGRLIEAGGTGRCAASLTTGIAVED